MRKSALLFVFIPFLSFAQIIPSAATVDWSKAGFEGEIPAFNNIADVTLFGAIANDTIDDYPAVVSAIASLNNLAGVVYFPAGNYLIKTTITLRDSLIIRGAGSDSTTLTFHFNGAALNSIHIGYGVNNAYQPLVSGYLKDSRKLVVSNAQNIFAANDEIEIREVNGAWDIQPVSWADYSVGHFSKLDSVIVDTIWLNEPLRIALDSALNPEVTKIVPAKICGLECFKMVRADDNSNGTNYGIYFANAKNCWIRGVESERSICAHVAIDHSSHITISGCYFHDAYLYDGTSTRGYGVVIFSHSGANLIEDNIFRHLRHSMVVKQGANGNVFGYNYSIEPNRSEPIPDYGADICLHGHYAFANLFEGNICQNLQIDIVWGPSGPYNTFFRNKVELYGIIMSSGSQQSNGQNFVGNDVTSSQILQGFYTLNGTGHFQHGNNIKGTITPTGTNTLADVSYYLDSIPPFFWNLNQTLPSIGIPNSPTTDNIPARSRYVQGGVVTRCAYVPFVDTTTTAVNQVSVSDLQVTCCLVNGHELKITIQSSTTTQAFMRLLNVAGQVVAEENIQLTQGLNSKTVGIGNLKSGVYLLQLSSGERVAVRKLIVAN